MDPTYPIPGKNKAVFGPLDAVVPLDAHRRHVAGAFANSSEARGRGPP